MQRVLAEDPHESGGDHQRRLELADRGGQRLIPFGTVGEIRRRDHPDVDAGTCRECECARLRLIGYEGRNHEVLTLCVDEGVEE